MCINFQIEFKKKKINYFSFARNIIPRICHHRCMRIYFSGHKKLQIVYCHFHIDNIFSLIITNE